MLMRDNQDEQTHAETLFDKIFNFLNYCLVPIAIAGRYPLKHICDKFLAIHIFLTS
jgi:hypothetical protein